jgi:hypothetical protein
MNGSMNMLICFWILTRQIEPLAAAKVSDYSTNEEQLDDERERAIKEIMTCPTNVKIPNFGC